jgi:hypothetical protein
MGIRVILSSLAWEATARLATLACCRAGLAGPTPEDRSGCAVPGSALPCGILLVPAAAGHGEGGWRLLVYQDACAETLSRRKWQEALKVARGGAAGHVCVNTIAGPACCRYCLEVETLHPHKRKH